MRWCVQAAILILAVAFATPAPGQTPLTAEIKAGKVVGERTLRVKQGEAVTLTVTSDRKIVLHLHGYDIERTAEPDKPAVFSFPAKATGRFSIQSVEAAAKGGKGHSHGSALLYLEVLPR